MIRDQGDRQLDLMKNQGERQLDSIDKIGHGKKKIKQKLLNFLKKRIDKEIKENEDPEKRFSYTTTGGEDYEFSMYKNFYVFGNKIINGELSLDQAKNEQEKFLSMINKLKEEVLKPKKKTNKKNKQKKQLETLKNFIKQEET